MTTENQLQQMPLFLPQQGSAPSWDNYEEAGLISSNMRIPETQEEVDMVEQALADEMDDLCVTEQDKVVFEVHGLPQISDEEPDDIDAEFSELDRELERRLQGKRKKNIPSIAAIKQVMELYPGFINDKKFRLAFLRSERFDAKLAAEKMIKHFDVKAEAFGNWDILGRDVTMADPSSNDISILESGMLQFLPIRDASGRFVWVVRPEVFNRCTGGETVDNVLRAWWYIMNSMLKDEECQKRGIVVVSYMIGLPDGFSSLARMLRKRRDAMANRAVAFHYCYDSQQLRPWMAAHKMYVMTNRHRARFRPHFGNRQEAMFRLQTYGIPVTNEHFPQDGSVPLQWHREWLMIRKLQERQNLANNTMFSNTTSNNEAVEYAEGTEDIIIPGKCDVLFGKGKKTKEHVGNIRCNTLVEMSLVKYEEKSKFAKTEIAERILSMTHESGGRFLKWNKTEGWKEVDRETAREKISHYFRHLRKKGPSVKKYSPETQPSSSSPKRVRPPTISASAFQQDGRFWKQSRGGEKNTALKRIQENFHWVTF